MTKIMKKIVFLSAVAIVLLFSCKKETTKPPILSQTFEINSTGSTTWKYFSFDNNDTIAVSDPLSSVNWDLAFQRYRVRTNGGKSGSGIGSASNSYQKGQAGFDALKLVSDTATFVKDDSVNIAVQQGYATYVVNPLLYNWFTLELGGAQGTQIIPSDYIFVVKTGTGKYAKVWFKSYYSAANLSGYVTIQYKYQPDGTKSLE
jgi:hypothetical protein